MQSLTEFDGVSAVADAHLSQYAFTGIFEVFLIGDACQVVECRYTGAKLGLTDRLADFADIY